MSKNSPEAFRLEIDPEPADVISGSSGRRSPPRQGHDLPSDDERDSGDAEIPHHQVASGSSNGFRSSGHEAPPTSSFIDLTDISPSKFLHRRVTSTKSSSGSESSVDSRIAILQRLYPARMVERMLQRDTKRMTQTAKRKPQFDFDDTPVLPGQARIRKAAAPLDREIRGDSESSDVEGREASPLVESSQGSVISISSDADEDALEIHSPVTGIWDLRVGLARNAEAMEWDQIDYMLSRTSTTGKKRRSYAHHKSRQSGQGRSSGFKATVITDSARRFGPARQTLLPFNHQVGPSRTTVSNRNKTNAISLDLEGHGIEEDLEANPEMPAEVNINISEDDTRIAQGFRPRTKKKPRNLSGLHIFTSNQHHITSGRNVASYVTIDVEDESANHLLQHPNRPPRVQNPSKRRHMKHRSAARLEDFWLPQPRDQDRRNSEPPFPPADRIINAKYPSRKSVDFDAPLLPSGITFAEVTYLAKGYLHELLSLPGASGEALRPAPLSAFDCEMSTFSSASIFAENLGKLGDTLLPLIVDPSSNSLEGARLDWERNLHHTSQHVSWFLVHSCPDDLSLLNDTITNFLLRFEDVIEEQWTSTSSNDPPDPLTLELQWFAVELSWRTQSTLGSPHLNRMVQLLTRTLWIFGLEKVVKSIILEEGRILDSSTTPQRAAEIWICLIYLSQLPGDQSSSARHLVWDALRQILQSNAMQRIAVNELELSRWIWQGIFGLCAFSQFSVYGMVTSTPRLMPSWDIIASTLKHAPLAVDRDLPRYALRKRDKYVRLLVSRCMLLNSRWKWRLDRASPMFASLHTIFKSRQFSNLSDETADFPSFLRRNNPELLSDHQRSDTAFTLFLKLVVQAAKEAAPSGPAEATLSPMVKKFLSLAVPVGTVQFTKASPPSPHEISMLYNRFSAIAVAIYLEPTQSEKLVDRVRHHYLDFGKADRESRRACIRGALHLAILLQHLHLPLFGVLAWMGEMTDILVDEYRKIMPSEIQAVPRVSDKPSVVLCIQMLLRSIQRIVNTPLVSAEDHAERYPDPSLLQGRKSIRNFETCLPNLFVAKPGLLVFSRQRLTLRRFLPLPSK